MRFWFASDSNAQHFQYDVEEELGLSVTRRGPEIEISEQTMDAEEIERITGIAGDYSGEKIE